MLEALAKIPAEPGEGAPRTAPVSAPIGDARQPLMLVIDDEPSVGRFIAHAAEECGCRALATMNAESFRREYRLLCPDFVAVDLGMPGADGVELLRFLAQEKCKAPILIISGFDRRVLESAMRLGEALGLVMAGPLAKPIRFEEFADLLESLKEKAR